VQDRGSGKPQRKNVEINIISSSQQHTSFTFDFFPFLSSLCLALCEAGTVQKEEADTAMLAEAKGHSNTSRGSRGSDLLWQPKYMTRDQILQHSSSLINDCGQDQD
jgi:hypothetical protein